MRSLLCGLLLAWQALAQEVDEQCTIGVACGKAAADGRPLLWKNRDGHERDNVVMALADGKLAYFALCNAGNSDAAWGGANVAGFCIVNAVSRDLPEGAAQGPDNGAFIKLALQQCETVAQFEALLAATDKTGRRTRANFAVIDAQGAAAIFEAGPASSRRFDAAADERGVLVRTNFSITGNGERGRERCARAEELCAEPAAKPLTVRYLLQQFLRDLKAPPSAAAGAKGRLDARETIHRQDTVAALVLQGVQKGEDAKWTTMWTLLGQPLFAFAVPLWPAAGALPRSISGDPRSSLCAASQRLAGAFYEPAEVAEDEAATSEGDVAGAVRWLRTDTMPPVRRAVLFGEAEILARCDETVEKWRQAGAPPAPAALRAFQDEMAKLALERVTDLAEQHAPQPTGK
jgi:hypothetical protein